MALDQVYSIQWIGPYSAIQACFQVNCRNEPSELFIAKQTAQRYQFGLPPEGGGADRAYLLRYLFAHDTSIPPGLLACPELDSWLLDTPTPSPAISP